jgi:signal transduction histidine kinase
MRIPLWYKNKIQSPRPNLKSCGPEMALTANSDTTAWFKDNFLAAGALQSGRRWLVFFAAFLTLDFASAFAARSAIGDLHWNLALGLGIAAAYRYGATAMVPIFVSAFLGAFLGTMWLGDGRASVLYCVWHGALVSVESIVPVVLARILTHATGKELLTNQWFGALLVAIPVSLLTSALHSGSLMIGAGPSAPEFGDGVARLWVGDLAGILVTTPIALMLMGVRTRPGAFKTLWHWEVLGQCVFALALVWFVFVENALTVREYFYMLSLPIIWITWRHGCAGAAVVNAFLLGTLMVFLSNYESGGVLQLPTRMIVLVMTALTLGMAVDQGRTAARRLRTREQELSVNLKAGETSELAGALAHELSHPLGAISNYAAVINHKLDAMPNLNPDMVDLVSRLRQEVRRATEKIQRLREFFRSGSLQLERVDITQIARESVALLTNKLESTDIGVRISSMSGPTYVTADPIQLHSVIHNLIVNAIEELKTVASPQKVIAITVRHEGRNVLLSVEDSGKGVSPDIADHAFEPMATTKRTGLGLGLSMSKSIVQAHGGQISFERSPFGGARFCVTLPSTP